jgi:hypothetical protein
MKRGASLARFFRGLTAGFSFATMTGAFVLCGGG